MLEENVGGFLKIMWAYKKPFKAYCKIPINSMKKKRLLNTTISNLQFCMAKIGLQGLFKEIELKASGQDKNYQTLIITPPVSL